MKIMMRAAALAFAFAMAGSFALAEPEQPAQPEAAAEDVQQPENLTMENAVEAAQQAYPGYAFKYQKTSTVNKTVYFRLQGTPVKGGRITVYVSANDGTVLSKEEYDFLKDGGRKDAPTDAGDGEKDEEEQAPQAPSGMPGNGMMLPQGPHGHHQPPQNPEYRPEGGMCPMGGQPQFGAQPGPKPEDAPEPVPEMDDIPEEVASGDETAEESEAAPEEPAKNGTFTIIITNEDGRQTTLTVQATDVTVLRAGD